MDLKSIVKLLTPPLFMNLAKKVRNTRKPRFEWEYIPEGWEYGKRHPEVMGWNVQHILDAYQSKWPRFVSMLEGTGPLGVAHESSMNTNEDINNHNTIMAFAYVLALAARNKARLSILDWGGGIGHYYLLSKALLEGVEIDYHCKDLPILADFGARLFPEQHFYVDSSCFERTYDLVLASASLQYTEDWPRLVSQMARVSDPYIYITRLPTVIKSESFVFIQRPYDYGYHTEYLGWCLNRAGFLSEAERSGLLLMREFVIAESPPIANAPERCKYRGFLFRSASSIGKQGG